jgi:hypothetical protein
MGSGASAERESAEKLLMNKPDDASDIKVNNNNLVVARLFLYCSSCRI